MAETKVKNQQFWYVAWALIIVGALFSGVEAFKDKGPSVEWKRVAMDGHRTGAQSVTLENVETALGTFKDEFYLTPSGVQYPLDSPVAEVASVLMEVQPRLATLKTVVGHSDGMYMNLRNQPDLPLGNLFADVLRSAGSTYFKVPMDFAVTNYGGIRCPLPQGPVTLEDISSMFPFKNYMCYVQMRGSSLITLLEQLASKPAFQAVSGCKVQVRGGKLVSALVGGAEIDPQRLYNVTTIDFLLDGGDQLNIGALSEKVVLSHVLLKDVMLDYVRSTEAAGQVISAASDGRVVYFED